MSAVTKDIKKPHRNPLVRFMPILVWLPAYDRSWLTADILAVLTLWGLVVPEAMD
jgi:MFS superfamily sulfate permease-like transporter